MLLPLYKFETRNGRWLGLREYRANRNKDVSLCSVIDVKCNSSMESQVAADGS
jgi:hypothetical protein